MLKPDNLIASILLLLSFIILSFQSSSFKTEQKRYKRVRAAYADKGLVIEKKLKGKSINPNELRLYIRAFKDEGEFELWGKNAADKTYKLIKEYAICAKSGDLGPKRAQGDYQVPEGYYHIDRFNPASSFLLSLGINYPNKSDKILGKKGNLGGDIFIHGSCVTIGCIPLTDDKIKEVYLYCVEAKNSGQKTIPVTIFPQRLSKSNLALLKKAYENDLQSIKLWEQLKKGYDLFNNTKTLPNIVVLSNGQYQVR